MNDLKICVNCITSSICSTRNATNLVVVCKIFNDAMQDCGHDLERFGEKYVNVEGIDRQFRLRRVSENKLVLYDMFVDHIDHNAVIIGKDISHGHRNNNSFVVF